MTPKHVVVGIDLHETSLAALRLALSLAAPLGARVTLIHVLEPTPAPPGLEAFALEGMPPDWEERLSRGRQEAVRGRLADLVAAYRDPAVPMEAQVVTGLLPAALVEATRGLQADLLVLGTHGRSGVAHLLLGSVAEKVVRAAPCPVLTVRPH